MARAARVPLVPVTLWGSQRVWTKGRRPEWRRARHVPVAVTVGPPIDARAAADPTAALREAMEQLLLPDAGALPGGRRPARTCGGGPPTSAARRRRPSSGRLDGRRGRGGRG